MKQLSADNGAPKTAAFLRDVQTVLRATKAEPKGATLEVDAALRIDPKATAATAMETLAKLRQAAKRVLIANDLKQLALAWQVYSDTNGMLPTAVYDKDGKALLSWRVQILPYIEGDALYKEFRLDEPWDSEHNKKLLEKMPKVCSPRIPKPTRNTKRSSKGSLARGRRYLKRADCGCRRPDGTFYTLLFVEAKKAVPWTKPDDISSDAGKLLPKVGGLSKDGFWAAMCDGRVEFIPLTVKEEVLRAWITRNSGEAKPDLDK